jgi:hypothetical protein
MKFMFDIKRVIEKESFTTNHTNQHELLLYILLLFVLVRGLFFFLDNPHSFTEEKIVFVPKLRVSPCTPWLILILLDTSKIEVINESC